MLKIRLKRCGRKKQPSYRIVVIDSKKRRDGKPIEEIGLYDPLMDKSVLKLNRLNYYLSCGAQQSPTVASISQTFKTV